MLRAKTLWRTLRTPANGTYALASDSDATSDKRRRSMLFSWRQSNRPDLMKNDESAAPRTYDEAASVITSVTELFKTQKCSYFPPLPHNHATAMLAASL